LSDTAIKVRDLSKLYRLGLRQNRHDTLRDAVMSTFQRSRRRSEPGGDTLWALKDISFDVRHGQAIAIIGKNGAGKSTLLKILSQITEPTTGRAEIHGRVGSLLEVGTGFHPELTGRDNIFLNGAILGMSRREIRRKFDEIVDFAEVERFIDTPVKRYSSGMYVRLAFAVAAYLEPEILIVDEVLAVGDAAFQRKCLGKMDDVAKGGRTVLFVSHNLAAVSQLCREAVWLESGRIEKIDESAVVVRDYLSKGAALIPERRWSYPGDAPGDDRVRLLSATIRQSRRNAPIVDINAASEIELEFAVLRDVRNLITGININNAMGLCLFSNCDWRPNTLQPGRYRKSVELPAQLLAEGRFSILVQLIFYDPHIKSVVLPSTLNIEAVDSDHPMAVRGHFKGEWPGAVRIGLPWGQAVRVGSDVPDSTEIP